VGDSAKLRKIRATQKAWGCRPAVGKVDKTAVQLGEDMAYIPTDAQWYVAEIVEQITVEGDSRNVVHKN